MAFRDKQFSLAAYGIQEVVGSIPIVSTIRKTL